MFSYLRGFFSNFLTQETVLEKISSNKAEFYIIEEENKLQEASDEIGNIERIVDNEIKEEKKVKIEERVEGAMEKSEIELTEKAINKSNFTKKSKHKKKRAKIG